MGGLALKHLGVTRLSALEYNSLSKSVIDRFNHLFKCPAYRILSYRDKQDFGDCDILINDCYPLNQNWKEQLALEFNSKGFVCNGDVTSMEINGFQFDFISVPLDYTKSAYVYFAYNDLGNFMGRIAHKMGFKYGHQGLQMVIRYSDNVVGTIHVSHKPEEYFEFMGYDFTKFLQGFDTLEDIFRYATSTSYFNKNIFKLENRNAASRARDSKRKTYTEFLKWCEVIDALPEFDWDAEVGPKDNLQRSFLWTAFDYWPEFKERYDTETIRYSASQELKKYWNGNLVKEWTGLEGEELGLLMAKVRNNQEFKKLLENLTEFSSIRNFKDLTRRIYLNI